MFTVLEVREYSRRSFLGSLFPKKRPPKPKVFIKQYKSVKYKTIEAMSIKGKLNWDAICAAAGEDSKNLIMPRSISPPASCPIKRYDSSFFMRRVLFNTATQLIKKSKITPREMKVMVLDKSARCINESLHFLEMAGTVLVSTHRTDDYMAYSENAVKTLGAGLVVTDRPVNYFSFDFLYAPFGLGGNDNIPSIFIKDLLNKFILSHDSFCLSSRLKQMIPFGISECDFAAALYQYANMQWLGLYSAEFLVRNGQKIFVKDIKIE